MSHIDVTEASFERDVLERSRSVPVVVDFWAGWCRPCLVLGPILERLADEADGSWVLAKLDVDSNQNLAATYGIQGIPAVKAFVNGRVADEFVGALPESQVQAWLARLGPSDADKTFEEGSVREHSGDLAGAAELFERALSMDPGHIEAKSALARVMLLLRSETVDEAAARSRFEADATDVEAARHLADALAARGELDGAFAVLLDAIRASAGDERESARLHLLSLLDTLPADDPRALRARRELGLAIF